MRKRKKKELFKNLHLVNMIPNLATLAALFIGLTQIRFALGEQWEYAIVAVIASAFLDATDGRLARFLNSCSRFGAELDSFSDFAVFGFCPAIVMYLYCLSRLGRPGWIVSVFFAICMCLRLARFNTHDIENIKGPLSGKFFTGVPAPAGAIIALYPVILHNAFHLGIFRNEYFSAIFVAVSGLLCISRIPTLSIKKIHIKREQYTLFLLCIIIAAGIVFAYTWKTLSIIIFLYICSIFFTARKAKMLLSRLNDQTITDK
ncbi:MAG: phosphatidylcholine/phosphatidylserine synthase [Holosporales bacterium]|jgi:CDP-diacylglycerol--serine O-phosphatidyltransferase|nr:phosphatidylcholine/phosphatidylserine synthase [Holosporales bacterium]